MMRKPLCVAGASALLAVVVPVGARSSSAVELAAYVGEPLDVWGKAIRDPGIQPE